MLNETLGLLKVSAHPYKIIQCRRFYAFVRSDAFFWKNGKKCVENALVTHFFLKIWQKYNVFCDFSSFFWKNENKNALRMRCPRFFFWNLKKENGNTEIFFRGVPNFYRNQEFYSAIWVSLGVLKSNVKITKLTEIAE